MMDWDWRRLPFAPLWVKLSLWGIVIMVLGSVAWVGIVQPNHAALLQAQEHTSQLKTRYRQRAYEVAALPDVDEQLVALNQQYTQLIAQLPEEEELAGLLAGVNEVGMRHQLQFETLAWQPRIHGSWLDAIPMNIVLQGQYQDIGAFSADIAAMTRLVSLQDFVLTRETERSSPLLRLSVSATTYRFTGRTTPKKHAQ
ncbi:type 4a pilus biogenesis protein PilO [Salinivibrio sp. ES.052]|uniref:type 4a pilus biogenesis protein PilO n=1 Tax=Salinivibrio sp. ES.052 TaxID=1882823 RepID=UPI00092ACB76|nr:type 4a pilus biogenesis protein PilO [Salinivibrio sp. ES.052]SIO18161.1 type IV pilus assembly protein PilO [Salinivibrio sp. ES.052]